MSGLHPTRAVEFQAWRIPPGQPDCAYALNVRAAITLAEAVHLACTGLHNFLGHKDGLLVQRIDHARGKHRAYLFRIVKLRRQYREGGFVEPLEAREERNWPIVEPIKMVGPPDVLADPVGRDTNLIEGEA